MVCSQLAVIAAILVNANRGKNTRPAKATDFLPWEPPPQTTEDMIRVAKGMALMFGDNGDGGD